MSLGAVPSGPRACEMKGLIWFLICMRRPKPRSTMVGKLRSLSVWPVGAVSNTTTEKFMPFTSLGERGVRPRPSLHCGPQPALRQARPHDLCVAHGLVDAWEGAHGLLHHLLAHAQHAVLLEELIGQLCHTQAGVDLLGAGDRKSPGH